jgi:hypothetical protein
MPIYQVEHDTVRAWQRAMACGRLASVVDREDR